MGESRSRAGKYKGGEVGEGRSMQGKEKVQGEEW